MFGLREGPLLNYFLLTAFLLQTLMIFPLIFHAVFFLFRLFFSNSFFAWLFENLHQIILACLKHIMEYTHIHLLFFGNQANRELFQQFLLKNFYQNSCAIYCRHQARTQEVANELPDELIQQLQQSREYIVVQPLFIGL